MPSFRPPENAIVNQMQSFGNKIQTAQTSMTFCSTVTAWVMAVWHDSISTIFLLPLRLSLSLVFICVCFSESVMPHLCTSTFTLSSCTADLLSIGSGALASTAAPHWLINLSVYSQHFPAVIGPTVQFISMYVVQLCLYASSLSLLQLTACWLSNL